MSLSLIAQSMAKEENLRNEGDLNTTEERRKWKERVMHRSMKPGLNFKLSMGNIINLTPPMNVTEEELSRAFSIIEKSIGDVS